ncbi:periplasmic binding protein-like II [Anaeromyces robustus]|uniref:Periplasmic binding protein-like II n=1 Tax=Anaeromyces robustus TaxID=1754192 RepID=A0A1Y1XIA0_9FUNG|nr:periplasmic binding protein-like II [Anaeromyces robustus]|eukprot:ORX85084.1 periplasmic binding protein-like II [Anaeromyces robustus]
MINYIILIILLIISIDIAKSVNINAIIFSECGAYYVFSDMVNDFNKYSKDNDLNININLNSITRANFTHAVEDYESLLDYLFKKKSNKYDLILFDSIYKLRFGPHLLNLKDRLPEEHVKMYMEGIANQTCIYNNKLIGTPIMVDANILYYNQDYLNKYNQTVPKTWDDLIKVGKYILDEEKKVNNTELIGYNGLFVDDEGGICSIYEFMYSFRNSINSPFPKIPSQEAVDALEKIKEIKNTISSDTYFKLNIDFSINSYIDKNILFMKIWNMPTLFTDYEFTYLPGNKEGVSGSVIGGYNIGINKYSTIKNQDAAITAFTYITSKYMQKKHVVMNNFMSPIPSLYEDEDICKTNDCEFYKNLQLIARPTSELYDYSVYTSRFREYVYEFLYGNKTALEALKNIEDLTKIYDISINSNEKSTGLIIFIIIIVVSIILIGSILYLFTNNYEEYFYTLPKGYWIVYLTGLLLIINNFYTDIGEISIVKCHLHSFIISIGSTMYIIPLLYYLIINFPENDAKMINWIHNHRYIFLSFFILFDIFINLLMLITPYVIEYENFNNNIYQTCNMTNTFGKIMIYLLNINKGIIILLIFLFIFMEWGLNNIYYYINIISISLYINIILYITFLVIKKTINFKNYTVFFSIRQIIHIFFVISNYIFIYVTRIVLVLMKISSKENADDIKINASKGNSIAGSNSLINSSNDDPLVFKISKKIINYHYKHSSNSDLTPNRSEKSSNINTSNSRI